MIAANAVALSPYLPATSRTVLRALGVLDPDDSVPWTAPAVVAGTSLGELPPLFAKVELEPEV